jgi:hypothetical protein
MIKISCAFEELRGLLTVQPRRSAMALKFDAKSALGAALGIVSVGALTLPLAVLANHQPGHVEAVDTAAEGNGAAQQLSEASKAFEMAMHKMHKNMALPYTNDVDVDFVRGMIPHHQGAIEQAEILLKYSKNPRLRRLAGGIIAAQKREIRFMEKWLKENAAGVDTGEMPTWLKTNPNTVEDAEIAGAPDKD